ncbi:hypothetical protein IQ266_04430 [filamentous cyanobacterium LEGE 11480]|uniref:Uncharacterized protein n=1 Tax=Romeriopsis navalis LEGE 11480 TaxID=2777977 RepID=A0A928VI29_9CYAN|nr:hypothetical protein [Romeriopsis navalis]MBE9029008.1 hypothetical protein [Romeriopsis navalis LEGE 11480]
MHLMQYCQSAALTAPVILGSALLMSGFSNTIVATTADMSLATYQTCMQTKPEITPKNPALLAASGPNEGLPKYWMILPSQAHQKLCTRKIMANSIPFPKMRIPHHIAAEN